MSALKPGEVTQRKLTPGQAADQWLRGDELAADAKALKEQAAAVLKPHMLKTGKPFKGLRLKATGGGWVLDGDKVKALVGARLREFQKQQKAGHTIERIP